MSLWLEILNKKIESVLTLDFLGMVDFKDHDVLLKIFNESAARFIVYQNEKF